MVFVLTAQLRARCRHRRGRNARQSPARDTAQKELCPRHADSDNGPSRSRQAWRREQAKTLPHPAGRERRRELGTAANIGPRRYRALFLLTIQAALDPASPKIDIRNVPDGQSRYLRSPGTVLPSANPTRVFEG